MWDPYSIEQLARYKHAEDLRRAERGRLIREARRARRRLARPGRSRRALHWIGSCLVALGQRLQVEPYPGAERRTVSAGLAATTIP